MCVTQPYALQLGIWINLFGIHLHIRGANPIETSFTQDRAVPLVWTKCG